MNRSSSRPTDARTTFASLKTLMPRKIRELIADLQSAGFVDRGGKGSHRNFVHPKVTKPVTLSGKLGDDAKHYQERAVQAAIEESKK
jgi:predicted RNA binding protein YcfA (HicA-like mRNA interferase family)